MSSLLFPPARAPPAARAAPAATVPDSSFRTQYDANSAAIVDARAASGAAARGAAAREENAARWRAVAETKAAAIEAKKEAALRATLQAAADEQTAREVEAAAAAAALEAETAALEAEASEAAALEEAREAAAAAVALVPAYEIPPYFGELFDVYGTVVDNLTALANLRAARIKAAIQKSRASSTFPELRTNCSDLQLESLAVFSLRVEPNDIDNINFAHFSLKMKRYFTGEQLEESHDLSTVILADNTDAVDGGGAGGGDPSGASCSAAGAIAVIVRVGVVKE